MKAVPKSKQHDKIINFCQLLGQHHMLGRNNHIMHFDEFSKEIYKTVDEMGHVDKNNKKKKIILKSVYKGYKWTN